MSMLNSNPNAAMQVAHQTITDRVQDAQVRAQRHGLRAQRRTDRRTQRETRPTPSAPSHPWATRLRHMAELTHLAH